MSNGPEFANGPPKPPRHLSKAAKAVFRSVAAQLHDLGALRLCDLFAIERYAETWVRWRACMDVLVEAGETEVVADPDVGGQLRQRPEARLVLQFGDQLRGLERELGLSPSARKRIDIGQPDKRARNGRPPNSVKREEEQPSDITRPRLLGGGGA